MKYALKLAEDRRIQYACDVLPNRKYDSMPTVDVLPDGNIYEYRYVDGEYIHDPIPRQEQTIVAPRNILAGEYVTVGGVLYKALENIPNGEPIFVGQNAVATTIEEQLYELRGE